MRNYFFLLSLVAFFSCSKPPEEQIQANVLENLQVTVDSLVIDSGEEIFVPNGLFQQSIAPDGNRLFAFYENDFEFFEFSIEDLKLIKRHPFQMEGPDGIDGWVMYMQVMGPDEIMILDQKGPNLFNLEGKKTKQYDLDMEKAFGFETEGPFSIPNGFHMSPDKSKFLSLPMNFGKPVEGLAVIDIESETGKILKLPALDMTYDYQVIWQRENSASFFGDAVSLQLVNDQFIAFTGSTADIYTYDYHADSLKRVTFSHNLVENRKEGEFPHEVDSRERQMEVVNQIRKQVTFYKFYWDPTRKMYFRFATKNMVMPVPQEGIKRSADAYIFAYDKDFNLIGESYLNNLENIPYQGYFHKGDFYSYSPMGDEAGFIRYSFEF